MKVLKVLVYLRRIGHRTVDVVKVTDNEVCPVDELVKLLRLVTHRLAIGVIEGEYHLDVAGRHGASEFGNEFIDRGHTGHQVRAHDARALVGRHQFLLQVMGKELAATTVREDKAIILKVLRLEVMVCYLLQKRFHLFSV